MCSLLFQVSKSSITGNIVKSTSFRCVVLVLVFTCWMCNISFQPTERMAFFVCYFHSIRLLFVIDVVVVVGCCWCWYCLAGAFMIACFMCAIFFLSSGCVLTLWKSYIFPQNPVIFEWIECKYAVSTYDKFSNILVAYPTYFPKPPATTQWH